MRRSPSLPWWALLMFPMLTACPSEPEPPDGGAYEESGPKESERDPCVLRSGTEEMGSAPRPTALGVVNREERLKIKCSGQSVNRGTRALVDYAVCADGSWGYVTANRTALDQYCPGGVPGFISADTVQVLVDVLSGAAFAVTADGVYRMVDTRDDKIKVLPSLQVAFGECVIEILYAATGVYEGAERSLIGQPPEAVIGVASCESRRGRFEPDKDGEPGTEPLQVVEGRLPESTPAGP